MNYLDQLVNAVATDPVTQVLAAVAPIFTVIVNAMAKEPRPVTWIIGLIGNSAWISYAVIAPAPGILLFALFMTTVHIRNLRYAVKKQRNEQPDN